VIFLEKVILNEELEVKIEKALLKRALGYEYEETEIIATRDGKNTRVKKIKKVVPPDVNALYLLLKITKKNKSDLTD
jgi:hypothetical protein